MLNKSDLLYKKIDYFEVSGTIASTRPIFIAGVSASNTVHASLIFPDPIKMKNLHSISVKLLMTRWNTHKFSFLCCCYNPSYSNLVINCK